MDIRNHIESLEEHLRAELRPKKLGVYGSGNSGYEALSHYMNGDRQLDDSVRKQLHEYRVFLSVLELWVDASTVDGDDVIFFEPTRGKGYQFETAPSLFVEPALPVYPEEELWENHHSDYHHLKQPADGRKRHTKPDMLLTSSGSDRLPWTARVDAPVKDESKLMSWCAHGEFKKVKDALGVEKEISSAGDCYSVVQTSDDRKNPDELFQDWLDFKPEAEYIIEVKHDPITEDDFSQILWYALAYETNLIIVSKYPISNQKFLHDIDVLPVSVKIVDNMDITTSNAEANEKISTVLD